MANLQIVISALNKASGDLSKIKGDIKGVGDAGKDAKGGVNGFADGIGSVLSKAALAAGAIAAVGVAIKQVYDTAKEGAALEYARSRFDNLAESIGTVSDALLEDLRDATGGMMSDAELVAGAADFMALGLAKSHDEVVRLTSVAGALGMNMNQLVLTLTNQTTMRFDALGVSVDGFDAKVKALEASGLSANEAFTEAFLQQAEAQIAKVGNKAESSAGQIQIMESAFKNLGDAIKLTMADAMDGLAPAMTSLANHMTENVRVGQQWEDVTNQLKEAKDSDLITGKEYNAMMRDLGVHSGMGAATTEQLEKAMRYLAIATGEGLDNTQDWAEANYEGAEGMAAAQAAAGGLKQEVETLTEAQLKMIEAHKGITSLESNYKGIIDLAYKYTDMLKDITEQEEIMAKEPIGSEKYEEAKGKVEALKGSMADLANRVTLDMFQATIAIGGVTAAELSAYMQMAVDMGVMSKEGAQAAIDAYGKAIETINGYKIDEKTGNVSVDAVSAFATLDLLQQYSLLDKEQRVFVTTYYGTSHGYDPYNDRAVGGAVTGGNPYVWQEYGYRGELFIPSVDGFVLSRADAERALARALYGGESAIDPEAIGKAVAKALSGITGNKQGGNVYNLTMPTSSNPADVRTAFELMEAWA